MLDYSKIDRELFQWTSSKGYTVQTQYRDDVVRGFVIWSKDNQKKSEIGITNVTDSLVELVVFDGKRRRERMSSSINEFTCLLDRAERLALQWIA